MKTVMRTFLSLLLICISVSFLHAQGLTTRIKKVYLDGDMILEYSYDKKDRVEVIHRYGYWPDRNNKGCTARDVMIYGLVENYYQLKRFILDVRR